MFPKYDVGNDAAAQFPETQINPLGNSSNSFN